MSATKASATPSTVAETAAVSSLSGCALPGPTDDLQKILDQAYRIMWDSLYGLGHLTFQVVKPATGEAVFGGA